jgi:hypothetical protein
MQRLSSLDWLMRWYEAQCDGEWEHGYGIAIDTLDNPGWSLKVNLQDTACDGRVLEHVMHNYDHETEWWVCWIEGNQFHARGGPLQLDAMIEAFRRWVEEGSVRPRD